MGTIGHTLTRIIDNLLKQECHYFETQGHNSSNNSSKTMKGESKGEEIGFKTKHEITLNLRQYVQYASHNNR